MHLVINAMNRFRLPPPILSCSGFLSRRDVLRVGTISAISTTLPGILFGEPMSQMARIADQICRPHPVLDHGQVIAGVF